MTRRLGMGILIVLSVSITLLSESPRETYQRALVQEQAAGNLKEAIALYRSAAAEAGSDRSLAAKALIRAAGAEEKLRDPHALESYMEILRTYSEQKEQVVIAQTRLAALRREAPTVRQPSGQTKTALPTVVERTLNTYCVTCHDQARNVANLNLESLGSHGIAENTAAWENVLRYLRARRMPPADQPRPDEGTYLTMISSLEVALDQAYPVNATLSTNARVTDEELANRMAGFIWGPDSRPDTALLEAAQRGRLRDPAVLEQQVRRMLRDPKSSALASAFFERWMLSDRIKDLAGSDKRSPDLVGEIRLILAPVDGPAPEAPLLQSFETETRLFLQSQIRDDRPAMELWTANYSFVNAQLARHYGIQGVSGNEFRRVTLPGSERAGILGQGSFLSVTSQGTRTSPSVRGNAILKLFLGTDSPGPLPPNIPPLATSGVQADRSMRERLAEHTTNRACATCHRIFDPLGLSLENFDSNGAFRRTQNGVPVDASGAFIDGTKFNGPAEFRESLMKYRDAYYNGVTQRMLGFALGRQPLGWKVYDYEMPTVRAIVREAAASDYRWSSVVLGIVKSTPFQMRNIVP
jgi:Protein of unknown function (DUF1592)/Protein of unknown function (DUF1588)/Protein of unknown function (DUF1585)